MIGSTLYKDVFEVFAKISVAKDFTGRKPSEKNEEAFKRSTKDGSLLPWLLLEVPGGKTFPFVMK